MAPTVLDRRIRPVRCLALLVFLLLAMSSSAVAQQKQSAIGDAILAFWGSSITNGNTQSINGRLFGGVINAQIVNAEGDDPKKLGPNDRVLRFEIGRPGCQVLRVPAGQPEFSVVAVTTDPQCLRFPAEQRGTSRGAFTDWVKENADKLLPILFPTSMSESASGRDAAQNHAQQFLLNTALGTAATGRPGRPRKAEAGGLVEFEQFDGDDRSGTAVQGLYRFQKIHLSLLGRYANQNENEHSISPGSGLLPVPVTATKTTSYTIATDFHPSVVVNPSVDLRIWLDARSGLFFAQSALDFGSVDVGGGFWTSAQKDFSRVRIGVGGLVQGSKSYVPLGLLGEGDEVQFLAKAFNNGPITWDYSYGGVLGLLVTERTSLNGKFLETRPVESARDTSTIVMGSVSYLVGGLTPVDVGYKVSTARGITSHSVFLQGYYGW